MVYGLSSQVPLGIRVLPCYVQAIIVSASLLCIAAGQPGSPNIMYDVVEAQGAKQL